MKFNLNDASESKQENPSLSDDEPLIEQKIDLKNISDSYLLFTAPKFLSDIQKQLRKKLKKKYSITKRKWKYNPKIILIMKI